MLILLELPPTLNDKEVHVPAEPIKQLIQLVETAAFDLSQGEPRRTALRILELDSRRRSACFAIDVELLCSPTTLFVRSVARLFRQSPRPLTQAKID